MSLENGNSAKEAYLAELRAEVERKLAIIAAIESGGEDLPNGLPGGATSRRPEKEVRPDSFYGLTTPQAVRRFLEMMGKGNPQSPTAIADALVRGGLEGPANVVLKNIYTAFKRGKDSDFVKIGKLWGLVDFYPRKEDKPKPKGKGKGKKKKRAAGGSARTKPATESVPATAPAKGGFGAFNEFVQEYKKAGKSRQDAIADWRKRGTT